MRLLIISHKEIWPIPQTPGGYATHGGFPFQVQALAGLFEQTTLIAAQRSAPAPGGLIPLRGKNLAVKPLPEPPGTGLRRKVALLAWLPRHLPGLWRAVREADVVHTPIPGDLGTIGLLLALAERKRLFVRHCGTWGTRETLAERFLAWLLPRIAGGRNVVLATGGGEAPPEPGNPHIHWIFSTTLAQAEWEALPQAQPWQPGETLRLVTVGRLAREKNIEAALGGVALLREQGVQATLAVIGGGPDQARLESLAGELRIAPEVTFHGNKAHSQVMELLAEAHLFVFPTRVKEGFPKALLEAMACGLPAVATRVSVIPHLLRDCGRVLDNPTPEALAQAVLELTKDAERLAELGRQAREASRGYTLEGWADKIREELARGWGKFEMGNEKS